MATVLISQRFIDDVGRLIDRLRDDDIRFKCGDYQKANMGHIQTPLRFLEMHAWTPEYAHQANDMPERWKKQSSRMDFKLLAVRGDGAIIRMTITAGDINNLTWFPPDFNSYHDHEITEEQLKTAAADPAYPEAAVLLENLRVRLLASELQAKWSKTREEVLRYFTACPSVNKAVALTPAMKMYVPPEYMKKIEAPAPEKMKREIPKIDAGQLAAHAVEVSLARSINGGAQ